MHVTWVAQQSYLIFYEIDDNDNKEHNSKPDKHTHLQEKPARLFHLSFCVPAKQMKQPMTFRTLVRCSNHRATGRIIGRFHTRDRKLVWDGWSVSDEFPVLAWKQDGYNFRQVTRLILPVYFSVALDGVLRRVSRLWRITRLKLRKGNRASASKWNWQVVRLVSNSH